MQHHVIENNSASSKRMKRVIVYRDGLKRWSDIFGVFLLSPIILPLIGFLWILTRLDGGTGFFGHLRVGQDGKQFMCWKIRTMAPNAQTRLTAHLLMYPDAAKEWAATYKLQNDPRVTRLGRFLRKTSLDELPQLWNVLIGEMSLVGPRPVPKNELQEYAGYEWAYLMMRPGITGVWQVSGRNNISYRDRVSMDVGYLLKISWKTDMQVLWKTIGVVLQRTGV
jgi:lipopolysaccharide/colanic/teichoic acid biosynthesis glycosyltransferase